jgi:outer membrane receptor protein involved in Fe transport
MLFDVPMRPALGMALLLAAGSANGQTTERSILDLSLDELVDMVVVSASRQPERLSEAPATVIVLTRDDLAARGYRDLSEIYDDLPGMDLSRAFGDTTFRNQWRGLRKSISVPYQLLLDGQPLNHLYFNQDEIIAALPMSGIERVEVVYGPSAVIYGANAFVGVVNIVTAEPSEAEGLRWRGRVTAGSFDRRIADMHVAWRHGEHALRLGLRQDEGNLDRGARGSLPGFSDAYYADRRLWGAFADGRFGGRYASEHRHRAADLRWHWREWTLLAQQFELSSGYGNVYAGDTVQNDGVWREPEQVLAISHRGDFGAWRGETMLRWRSSGVADDSYFVEAYDVAAPGGGTRRVVDFSYWGSENRSLALTHDGEWPISERWSLVGGARIERKDLQKAYRTNFGPAVAPGDLVDLRSYPFPPRADFDTVAANRVDTRQWGGYMQLRRSQEGLWWDDDRHTLTVGLRHDEFSAFDGATTVRGGYVVNRGPWTAKLLFGESFNEPAPRELYGGWRGSGSDPDLAPETGATRELNLGWQGARAAAWVSAWDLHTRNDIVTIRGGAANLGRRESNGIDLGLRARWGEGHHEVWAYQSWITANEDRIDHGGIVRTGPVGDTAEKKTYAGWTWRPNASWTSTLRARRVSARDTVSTNPVGRVDSYATADWHLRWRFDPTHGLSVALGVFNLTDRRYAHPGLREAAAGTTPGRFAANGQWLGSPDFFSSLLPQPGRALHLTLEWER